MDSQDIKNNVKIKYPRSVFLIIANHFCERSSIYGMRTILPFYLRDILLYNEDDSTSIYHSFVLLFYIFPIIGAILADSCLGKFRTTIYLAILYIFGYILLSVSSIPNLLPQIEFSMLSLLIIAIGTGAIASCLPAFGGDQFARPEQDKQLQQYFAILYFVGNAGVSIFMYSSPYLRGNVHCFNQDSCFPLGFGVSAILMIIALALFLIGKSSYKIQPTERNVIFDVSKCIGHAIGKKIKSKGEKRDHWLDYASENFDEQLIKDIKQVLRVLVLYLPIPIFWALFDQQGSRWTFQAARMDGTLGSITILPDQFQIANPLLILALVPTFDSVIYPLSTKCGLVLTPLKRMSIGGLFAALAFVVSGAVELLIEPTYAQIPGVGFTNLNFINTLPCSVTVNYPRDDQIHVMKINASSFGVVRDLKSDKRLEISASIVDSVCVEEFQSDWHGTLQGASEKSFSVVITKRNGKLELDRANTDEPLKKSNTGFSRISFLFDSNSDVMMNKSVTIKSHSAVAHFPVYSNFTLSQSNRLIETASREIESGMYNVFMPYTNASVGNITVKQGGCYVVLVQRLRSSKQAHHDDLFMLIEITAANSVHMLWLVPQYFVLTVAEVMFSVTGYTFCFTQAPSSMRAIMSSCWLLTVAFGNVIVIMVASVKGMSKQWMEFFLFAGLMLLDMLLFFFLASRYTYVGEKKKCKKIINDALSEHSE